jgi:hypothetical protein
MLATFCLRLACGMIAALLVLAPAQVPPRFFRVQYLTALGLLAIAGFFLREVAGPGLWLFLGLSALVTFVGSIIWHVEGSPGQRIVLILANLALWGALLCSWEANRPENYTATLLADDLASAILLGAATSAMLMGHSYLIAPAMTLSPLYRLLGLLGVTLVVRIILACVGLSLWTGRSGAGSLETEMVLWLGVRWIIGLVGPLVLGWLAWETARIRSTQSATGILYVVVILVFLGELTSQLLLEKTGFML